MIWVYIIGLAVLIIGMGVFFGAPYVPSHRKDVRRLFEELYPLSEADVVFDAGSGDGLILREVSKRGAKAIGYEVNPLFWALSKIMSAGYRNITIKLRNFWLEPFPDDMTFLYIFTVSSNNKRLIAKLQRERLRLGRPFTVVCYGSPLAGREPAKVFGAYSLYEF